MPSHPYHIIYYITSHRYDVLYMVNYGACCGGCVVWYTVVYCSVVWCASGAVAVYCGAVVGALVLWCTMVCGGVQRSVEWCSVA